MASDKLRHAREIDADGPQYRERMGHDGWLRIFGELELVLGAIAHQSEQILPERLIYLVEDIARRAARAG